MKNCRSTVCWTTTWLALALSAPCFAQDNAASKPDKKPAGGADDAQMMGAMMEMARPGENHKILEATVGNWNYKVKWWMHPDTPPMEYGGSATTKSLMDGRYFTTEHGGKMTMPGPDGKMLEMEFKGTATEGYDNAKKKYVSSWIDNMGTGIMLMEGTYDPAAKTLTYIGEEEPLPGMKFKVRETVIYTDKDHHKMEYFEVHDGGEVKIMEIDYTRSS
jgi:hypothetical protein